MTHRLIDHAAHRVVDHALAHLAIRLDRATRAVDMLALRRLLARYDTSVYAPFPASAPALPLPTPRHATPLTGNARGAQTTFGFPTYDSFDDLA